MYLILEGTGREGEWHWKEDPCCTFSILMYATKHEAMKAAKQFQKENSLRTYQVQRIPNNALPTSIRKNK